MIDLFSGVTNLMTRRRLEGLRFSELQPEPPKSKNLGLYVHIPFCRIPCPYCPYTRYPWKPQKEKPYVEAVKKEISIYHDLLPGVKIDSLYIGGGTPTVMIDGLARIIEHIRSSFSLDGDISIEANPDDLNQTAIDKLHRIGVSKISLGVQSFKDNILRAIGRRSHNGDEAFEALKLAAASGFDCVNADLMFFLPSQSISDIVDDLEMAVKAGAPQITTYPLLLFPYAKVSRDVKSGRLTLPPAGQEKAMYREIVKFLTSNGYEMCTVWSFSRQGVDKYGSVERSEYIGVGAGAISVTNECTYTNTHSVDEYIKAVDRGLPVAVGVKSSKPPLGKWVMMRLYEMGFTQAQFIQAFGEEAEADLKRMLRPFRLLGIIDLDGGDVRVTPQGVYPVYQMTKTFLTTYIARLCEECLKNPWPKEFTI